VERKKESPGTETNKKCNSSNKRWTLLQQDTGPVSVKSKYILQSLSTNFEGLKNINLGFEVAIYSC